MPYFKRRKGDVTYVLMFVENHIIERFRKQSGIPMNREFPVFSPRLQRVINDTVASICVVTFDVALFDV